MRARLPKWASTDTFEIRAVAPGSPTPDQMRLMVQSLLADRFSLKLHFDTAQTPVLALVLDKPGKTGPKLRPHSEGPPCDVHNADVFPPMCDQLLASDRPNHAVLVGARNMTIDQIAAFVSSFGRLDRPVVDQTSLSGNFDFTLEFTNHPQPDAERTTRSRRETFGKLTNRDWKERHSNFPKLSPQHPQQSSPPALSAIAVSIQAAPE
jgi:bla regulator protein blaR1